MFVKWIQLKRSNQLYNIIMLLGRYFADEMARAKRRGHDVCAEPK